jgi:hypothetical protein
MRHHGDDDREMPNGPTFDDGEIDAILAGTARDADLASLASFVGDVRSVSGAVPTPSAALAAALASGISSDAPATVTPQPLWRKLKMKIQALIAGLGVAGKIALGAGVAAAATTGAGAAGVLPGPVQHAFASAVDTVTPFNAPDGNHHGSEHGLAGATTDGTTTTTLGDTTSTTTPTGEHDGDGDGHGVVPTPTTEAKSTTTTSEPKNGDEKNNDDTDNGDGNDGANNHESTPTTVHHEPESTTTTTVEHHENHNPETIALSCSRGREPNRVSCSWTASANPEHQKYVLLRTGDGHGRVITQTEDGLSFSDTMVSAGQSYEYRIISLRSDGSVESHSNLVTIVCCGD